MSRITWGGPSRIGQVVAFVALSLIIGCAEIAKDELSKLEQHQQARYQQVMRMAHTSLDGGDATTASLFLKQAQQINPRGTEPLLVLAAVAADMNNPDAAVRLYRQALDIDARNVEALVGFANMSLKLNRPQLAKEHFATAIAADPANSRAYSGLGISYDLLGDHAQAQDVYRRALATDAANPTLRNNLALSMMLSDQASAAIPILEELSQLPAAGPRYRHNLALAHALAGDMRAARDLTRGDLNEEQIVENLKFYQTARRLPSAQLASAILFRHINAEQLAMVQKGSQGKPNRLFGEGADLAMAAPRTNTAQPLPDRIRSVVTPPAMQPTPEETGFNTASRPLVLGPKQPAQTPTVSRSTDGTSTSLRGPILAKGKPEKLSRATIPEPRTETVKGDPVPTAGERTAISVKPGEAQSQPDTPAIEPTVIEKQFPDFNGFIDSLTMETGIDKEALMHARAPRQPTLPEPPIQVASHDGRAGSETGSGAQPQANNNAAGVKPSNQLQPSPAELAFETGSSLTAPPKAAPRQTIDVGGQEVKSQSVRAETDDRQPHPQFSRLGKNIVIQALPAKQTLDARMAAVDKGDALISKRTNLRAEPTPESALLKTLPAGTSVTLINPQTTAGYYRVNLEQLDGWIWGPNLMIKAEEMAETAPKAESGMSTQKVKMMPSPQVTDSETSVHAHGDAPEAKSDGQSHSDVAGDNLQARLEPSPEELDFQTASGLSAPPAAAPQERVDAERRDHEDGAVIVKRTNLRAEPTPESTLLKTLQAGTSVTLINPQTTAGYYRVNLEQLDGWIWGSNLSVKAEGVAETAPKAESGMSTQKAMTMRSPQETDFETSARAHVDVPEARADGKANSNVAGDNPEAELEPSPEELDFQTASGLSAPPAAAPQSTAKGRDQNYEAVIVKRTNLRAEPTPESTLLKTLPAGTSVTLINPQTTAGYYRVSLEQLDGWIWGPNLMIKAEEMAETGPKAESRMSTPKAKMMPSPQVTDSKTSVHANVEAPEVRSDGQANSNVAGDDPEAGLEPSPEELAFETTSGPSAPPAAAPRERSDAERRDHKDDAVIIKRSNLRAEPTMKSALLRKVPAGTPAALITPRTTAGYYRVALEQQEGWIWGPNLSMGETTAAIAQPKAGRGSSPQTTAMMPSPREIEFETASHAPLAETPPSREAPGRMTLAKAKEAAEIQPTTIEVSFETATAEFAPKPPATRVKTDVRLQKPGTSPASVRSATTAVPRDAAVAEIETHVRVQPLPAAVPKPRPSKGDKLMEAATDAVIAKRSNMRAKPTPESTLLRKVPAGTSVKRVTSRQTAGYYRVALGPLEGWIWAPNLSEKSAGAVAATRTTMPSPVIQLSTPEKPTAARPGRASTRAAAERLDFASVAGFVKSMAVVEAGQAVISRRSNLRAEPSPKSTLLKTLPAGTHVVLVDPLKTAGYYKVTLGQIEGWIWGPNLEPASPKSAAKAAAKKPSDATTLSQMEPAAARAAGARKVAPPSGFADLMAGVGWAFLP